MPRDLSNLSIRMKEAFAELAKAAFLGTRDLPKNHRVSQVFFQPWLLTYLLFCASSPVLFDVFRSRNLV